MAACCSRFVPATKCCCAEAWSAKNFRHCYYYLGLSIFLRCVAQQLKTRVSQGGSLLLCSFLKLPYAPMFPHVFLICSPFNKFAYHLSPPLIPFRKKKKTKRNKTKEKRKEKRHQKQNLWKKRIDCMWLSICVTHHLKFLSEIHNPSEPDEH